MNKDRLEYMRRLYNVLNKMGFDDGEIETLLRIEKTLHRWAERECNGEIERNEQTGKPFAVSPAYIAGHADKWSGWAIPDREAGALKRLEKIMESHPTLIAYHQTDPRGCALYILAKSDVPEGERIDAYYSRGLAICY